MCGTKPAGYSLNCSEIDVFFFEPAGSPLNRSANLTLLNCRGGPRGGRPKKSSCAAAVAGPHHSLAPHAERSVKYRGNIDSNTCHRRRMENPIPKLNFYDMFVFF